MRKILIDKALLAAVLEAMEDLHRTGDTQVFDMYAAPELLPALRDALAEQEPVAWPIETNNQVEALAKHCGWDNRRYMTPADYQIWCDRMRQFAQLASPQPAQQELEFFTHNVKQPYDWSEWVCPDPEGYLMMCCDCGLVHEAEFGVVRYKSETEREDCDMVDDPNLQAVFRMRRSEQWSPEDTAHRAGGLTMEQPAQQEPVAWMEMVVANLVREGVNKHKARELAQHFAELARALNKRQSEDCGVDKNDHWKLYGDDIKEKNNG